jgi:uncharacterized membrane protein
MGEPSQIAAVAADVMIVFLMLLGLYRARAASQATTSRATRLLLRIVAVTISTNALTTAICIFQLSNSYTNLGARACHVSRLGPAC